MVGGRGPSVRRWEKLGNVCCRASVDPKIVKVEKHLNWRLDEEVGVIDGKIRNSRWDVRSTRRRVRIFPIEDLRFYWYTLEFRHRRYTSKEMDLTRRGKVSWSVENEGEVKSGVTEKELLGDQVRGRTKIFESMESDTYNKFRLREFSEYMDFLSLTYRHPGSCSRPYIIYELFISNLFTDFLTYFILI